MESDCNGDSFVSSSSRDEEKVEAVDDLLEECWFFENLLKIRTRMLRCYSDPCPSNLSQDMLAKNSESQNTSSIEKMKGDGVVNRGVIRAPSLPPCIGRKEEKQEQEKSSIGTRQLTRQSSHQNMLQEPKPTCIKKKGGSYKEKESASKSKLTEQSSCRKLQKAPSLPPNIGRQDISQDMDSDARMSRLIQLAFANSSESLPLQNTSKGMPQSCTIPRHRPPRSSEVESSNTNGINEMSRRYLNQQKLIKKSLNDLETEEVQGFKDLGFTFEKKDLSPSVLDILPGLQEKKGEEFNQDIKMRRPYLSEAWLVQSCAPPVPNWVGKNSAEDMKKFWSPGAKKSLKEEALDNLKALGSTSIEAKAPPSPVQALLGGVMAGVIALILYKFTTTIEAALNRQTVSDNYSVRQITITIRTIVNGLCYLATFVFGINSIDLILCGGQLAINSFMEDSSSKETEEKGEQQSGSLNSTPDNAEDPSSDNTLQ